MIYFKIHRQGGEKLVAACDREIMGRTFSEGEIYFKIGYKFKLKNQIFIVLFLEFGQRCYQIVLLLNHTILPLRKQLNL